MGCFILFGLNHIEGEITFRLIFNGAAILIFKDDLIASDKLLIGELSEFRIEGLNDEARGDFLDLHVRKGIRVFGSCQSELE